MVIKEVRHTLKMPILLLFNTNNTFQREQLKKQGKNWGQTRRKDFHVEVKITMFS